MSRSDNIRWTKSDSAEFARLRKNYNAKVARLERQGLPAPERISKKDIGSRRDYNNFKKDYKDFTARGSERMIEYQGHKMPDWQKKQTIRRVKSVNERLRQQREKLTPTKGNMGLIKDQDYRKKDVKRKRTHEEWAKFIDTLKAHYRDSTMREAYQSYKEKYLEELRKEFGDKGTEIEKLVKNADGKAMTEAARDYRELTIDYIYKDPTEMSMKLSLMKKRWSEILNVPIEDDDDENYFDDLY